MSSFVEDLKDNYIESASQKLPFHRVAIFVLFVICFKFIASTGTNGLYLYLLKSKPVRIFDWDSGFIADIALWQLMCCALFLYLLIYFQKTTFHLSTKFLGQFIDLERKTVTLTRTALDVLKHGSIADVDRAIVAGTSKIKILCVLTEILLGLIFAFIICSYRSSLVDVVVTVLAFVLFLVLHLIAVRMYITSLFPFILTKKISKGEMPSFLYGENLA
ncbi:MAG: hypothetical protein ACOY3E_18295 [Pseudomonadota bacterium]